MFIRILFLFLVFIFLTEIDFAQGYVLLAPLPGATSIGTGFAEYLAVFFNIGIGLAAVLAVLMIVVGGVQYIAGAASPSARGDAKKRITNAILGLLLALGSWLIVYTINPAILNKSYQIPLVTLPTPPPLPPQSPLPPTPPISTALPSTPSLPPLPTSPPPPPTIPPLPPSPPIILSDPSNDYLIMRDCLGQSAIDPCTQADMDSNGKIDGNDFSLFLKSFKYDVNGDSIIGFGVTAPITYCSFKVNSGAIPVPFCIDDDSVNNADGIDDRFGVPCNQIDTGAVPSFNTVCATDNYNNATFSIGEFSDFKQVLSASLINSSAVDLRQLYTNLFSCDEGTCTYFDSNQSFINITYATVVNYDSNGDGVADFSGVEPQSDFNDDGQINSKDNDFADFLNKNIFKEGQSPFVPFNFILGKMEAFLFDSTGFPDRQIIEYCIGKTPMMDCAMADINGDLLVTNADLTEFDNNSPQYDINGDGVVNTFAP